MKKPGAGAAASNVVEGGSTTPTSTSGAPGARRVTFTCTGATPAYVQLTRTTPAT